LKKIGFIFSNLYILLGAITLIITSILNEVMPKLGRVAFETVASGNFSESYYKMNFSFVNFLAIVLIIAGSTISIRMYLSSHNK